MATVIKDMEHPDRYAKINASGQLETSAVFTGGDIEIGAVEIKNHSTDDRAYVDTSGRLHVYDESGGGGGSSAVLNGNTNVTTAGTAVPIAASTTCQKVTIKAKAGNTGYIYVGDLSVSSANGLVLDAGESVDVAIDDLSKVYIDASVNGEGVTYLGS